MPSRRVAKVARHARPVRVSSRAWPISGLECSVPAWLAGARRGVEQDAVLPAQGARFDAHSPSPPSPYVRMLGCLGVCGYVWELIRHLLLAVLLAIDWRVDFAGWVGRDSRWPDPRCSSSEAADGARASVRSPLCAFLGHDLISVRWTIWSALCVTCREGRPCRSPWSPRAAILLLLRAAGVRVRCQDSRYSQRSHTRTLAR